MTNIHPLPRGWDVGKSECVSTVRAHTSDVYSVRMHPNGTHFVSGGYDKTVRLFDARTGTEMKSLMIKDTNWACPKPSSTTIGSIRLWNKRAVA